MSGVKERVLKLCEDRNVRVGTLEREARLSNGTIKKWADDSLPNSSTLALIADYFGVSVDYLMGREPTDDVQEMLEYLHKDPQMKVLLSSSSKLRKKDLEAVVAIVQRMNGEDDDFE